MLGNRGHEGLQPPSNLEERKGLKEAQHVAHVRSAAHPHTPRTRGVISALLEGSPLKPSTAPAPPPRSRVASLPSREQIDSASLEATPRQEGQTALPLTRPPYGGIKCQPLIHSAWVRWRQAATPRSGCDRSPIRQLWSLLDHSRHCSDTVGTCNAVQDVLGTTPATVLSTSHTSSILFPPRNPRTA